MYLSPVRSHTKQGIRKYNRELAQQYLGYLQEMSRDFRVMVR